MSAAAELNCPNGWKAQIDGWRARCRRGSEGICRRPWGRGAAPGDRRARGRRRGPGAPRTAAERGTDAAAGGGGPDHEAFGIVGGEEQPSVGRAWGEIVEHRPGVGVHRLLGQHLEQHEAAGGPGDSAEAQQRSIPNGVLFRRGAQAAQPAQLVQRRPPGEGAAPSGFQSLVPARRMDTSERLLPVPFTSAKFPAPPASAGADDDAAAIAAANKAILYIGPHHIPARPRGK